MPRKRRDEEVVLSSLKRFIADKSCPWAYRVYCVNALAVATKVYDMPLVLPGTTRFRPVSNQTSEKDPGAGEENLVPEEDHQDFLKALIGGANART